MDDILFFDFNQKSSFLLFSFINSLIYSFLLLRKGWDENNDDSKWLAFFLILGGLYICPFMLGYAGWYSVKSYREFLFFIPFQQLFLIGPVFYFYIKILLNPSFRLTKKDVLHFLPAIAYLGYSIVVFIFDKLILDQFYFYADGRDKDLDFWYQMAGLISMLFYLIKSFFYYKDYQKVAFDEVSFAEEIIYKWIKVFILTFGLILVLRVLFFILNPEWGQFGSKYWYYLCFSILMIYISITGYATTVKTSVKIKGRNLDSLILLSEQNNPVSNSNTTDSIDVVAWKDQIIQLFDDEELYKNPNLTLSEVASLLKTNRNVISKIINNEFRMNFNDFVNKRRVDEILKLLKNGEHLEKTLLGIALDCGFNSKTTFNRAFKKHANTTPRQYIKKKIL